MKSNVLLLLIVVAHCCCNFPFLPPIPASGPRHDELPGSGLS
jgi:hypothetical protein